MYFYTTPNWVTMASVQTLITNNKKIQPTNLMKIFNKGFSVNFLEKGLTFKTSWGYFNNIYEKLPKMNVTHIAAMNVSNVSLLKLSFNYHIIIIFYPPPFLCHQSTISHRCIFVNIKNHSFFNKWFFYAI